MLAVPTDRPLDDLPLDALSQYAREVSAVPPLAAGEEERLLSQVRCGNRAARQRLVEASQSWVLALARRFAATSERLSLLDYVQEGNVALLEAVAQCDRRTRALSFLARASCWVRGAMRHAFWRLEAQRGLPEHQARAVAQLAGAQQALMVRLGREAAVEELATHVGMPVRQVLELLLLQQRYVLSLERFADGAEGIAFDELVAAPAGEGAHDAADEESLTGQVRHLVTQLPERERLVVTLRYGFADGVERTQREVADRLGLALHVVKALDRRARIRLRSALERHATVLRGAAA
jgi:RNA polymerase sigma factor (sigma-70 family)